ncbi:hypothetical protein B296_00019355 [Ensete ventricosum]|uniref:Uncharacterized protein n=1 Tax=Ensete ventricosum TaxID=4639 RepID=A0A427AU57_ENSVE|nr:hypothetical protein B296_00019355 [Ensete ventricosum]
MPHASSATCPPQPSVWVEETTAPEVHPREGEETCPKKKPKLGVHKISKCTASREAAAQQAIGIGEGSRDDGSGAPTLRASAFARVEQCTICSATRSSPRDGGLRNFQREEYEEKSCSNKIYIQEGYILVLQRENHTQWTAHVEKYLKTTTPQSSTDRASAEESSHDLT